MVTWYVPGFALPIAIALTTVTAWPPTVTVGSGIVLPVPSIAPNPVAYRIIVSPGMAGAAALTVGVLPAKSRWATTLPWPLPSTLNSAGAYFANVMGKAADVPIVTLEGPVAAL